MVRRVARQRLCSRDWRVATFALTDGETVVQVALPLDDVESAVARLRLLVCLFGMNRFERARRIARVRLLTHGSTSS